MFDPIELPYALDALEPVISANTLSYHFGKHLQAYLDNLNKALPFSGLDGFPLEDVVRYATGPLFNNAGQVLNHNMYFTQFSPAPHSGLDPESPLAKQIAKQWGTLDAFQADFEAKGVGLFGSGWVWLAEDDDDGSLQIVQEPGAGNPVTKGLRPLLTFDVWEHAYYLDYQNRRAAHLKELWKIVDWKVIEKRYKVYAK